MVSLDQLSSMNSTRSLCSSGWGLATAPSKSEWTLAPVAEPHGRVLSRSEMRSMCNRLQPQKHSTRRVFDESIGHLNPHAALERLHELDSRRYYASADSWRGSSFEFGDGVGRYPPTTPSNYEKSYLCHSVS